jgi:hypothetical protein
MTWRVVRTKLWSWKELHDMQDKEKPEKDVSLDLIKSSVCLLPTGKAQMETEL